ncbi:hypothetical protein ACQUQU_00250 [Thalassolituus sp. LLYu03]|uniref:hypothetical protein n=1 Tax=Thalassolituus sp. LLYu03 TaxID=3421656 RepID=UPI003D270B35
MVRVKQWETQGALSYLLVEPVSRRSALIDPVAALVGEYMRVIRMRGLHNLYVLSTRSSVHAEAEWAALPGERPDAAQMAAGLVLPLGESHIECFVSAAGGQVAYVADGHLFSGGWLLPFSLRQLNAAQNGDSSCMLPLLNFPDDTILHPGETVSGIRISSLAQEKALAVTDRESGGLHG